MSPRYSDRQAATELANALEELPDNFLRCRGLLHNWEVVDDFHMYDRERKVKHRIVIRQRLKCERCHSRRDDYFIETVFGLMKVGESREYVEGYLVTGVPRGVKPREVINGVRYKKTLKTTASKARSKKVVPLRQTQRKVG